MKLITGNSNILLANIIANNLNIDICKAHIGIFSDGETMIEILDNVRNEDIFIIQSITYPSNNNLMELVLISDAIRRNASKNIIAIIPYFGYARQDRVTSSGSPIAAKVIANILEISGITELVTINLHSDQIQGFFNIPIHNICCLSTIADDIKNNYSKIKNNITIVSPDIGGIKRARKLSKIVDKEEELVIVDKLREKYNEAKIMHIIGDVKNKDCIIIDDIIDTAGTLCEVAKLLKIKGANSIIAYCIHPVLSGKSIYNIANSDIDEIIVTDTIHIDFEKIECKKLRQISIAKILTNFISQSCKSNF